MNSNSDLGYKGSFIYPPGYVLPKSIEVVSETLKKVTYPDGFSCYTPSESEAEATLIYNEIITNQEYFRFGFSVTGAHCVMDIGANIGLFTLAVKKKSPDATIYAFEPIQETYRVLKENVRLQGCTDVHLFNVAVGAQDRTQKTFTYYPHMPGNTTSMPSIKDGEKVLMEGLFGKEMADYLQVSEQRSAQVRTLSSIIREWNIHHIDYLKIDVEGDELSVLEGVIDTDWPLIPQIVIETHSEALREQVREFLVSRQFEVHIDAGISSPTGAMNLFACHR